MVLSAFGITRGTGGYYRVLGGTGGTREYFGVLSGMAGYYWVLGGTGWGSTNG